jgi:PAS domain S-box-containing protein
MDAITSLCILIIDDSEEDARSMVRELRRGGYRVDFERVQTEAGLKEALALRHWDLIISDVALRETSGEAVLALLRQTGQEIPVILVSRKMGEDIAVERLKSGAQHYVAKDNLAGLVAAVSRELWFSQERQIRQQLEARHQFLASLVSSCHDAIIGKTLDGIVVSWNSGAERLYGYTAEEMMGRSIAVLCPHYRPEDLAEIMERIRLGERVEQLETVRLRKDGTPVEVSLVISPIKDANNRVVGASSVSRDISRRRQEEDERLALIQDLTAALSHSHS